MGLRTVMDDHRSISRYHPTEVRWGGGGEVAPSRWLSRPALRSMMVYIVGRNVTSTNRTQGLVVNDSQRYLRVWSMVHLRITRTRTRTRVYYIYRLRHAVILHCSHAGCTDDSHSRVEHQRGIRIWNGFRINVRRRPAGFRHLKRTVTGHAGPSVTTRSRQRRHLADGRRPRLTVV